MEINLKSWKVGTAKVVPGQKSWGQLTICENRQTVKIPVVLVRGRREGPHAVFVANQHGDEMIGVESCRLLAEQLDPEKLKGSVAIFPSLNPRAGIANLHNFPETTGNPKIKNPLSLGDKYNMNTVWPGRRGGFWMEAAAKEVFEKAVLLPVKASIFIDFHGMRAAPTVYTFDKVSNKLAPITGIPKVVLQRHDDFEKFKVIDPVSCSAFRRAGIPSMIIELGPRTGSSSSVDGETARIGLQSALNILVAMEMIKGKLVLSPTTVILDPWRDDIIPRRRMAPPAILNIYASKTGMVIAERHYFNRVKKGEVVCRVLDPFTGKVIQSGVAPRSGYLLSVFDLKGVCKKGDVLFRMSLGKRISTHSYVDQIKRILKRPNFNGV